MKNQLDVPAIDLVVVGDAVYNDVHLFLVESDTAGRQEWIAALDIIESLRPRAVIAGRKHPGAEDSPRCIEDTRRYLHDFDWADKSSSTAHDLYDKVLGLHPNRVSRGTLWGSARAHKPLAR